MPDILSIFSIFTSPEAWISLLTLTFLEIVLGIDNIVFISITSNRLPASKRHIGRKLGLAGAMLMRIAFLSVASALVHVTVTLFDVNLGFYSHGFSVRDFILLVGGSYLIYKGIVELRDIISGKSESQDEEDKEKGSITLPKAVGTIMIMDIVFSIDSVITAVGLAEHLIVMILAVMFAVCMMMVFIDAISDFIENNIEMKILAMAFITAIGVLLVLDSLGIGTGIEVLDMSLEKLMVYFAMVFSVALTFLQLRYKSNTAKLSAA